MSQQILLHTWIVGGTLPQWLLRQRPPAALAAAALQAGAAAPAAAPPHEIEFESPELHFLGG